MDSDVMVGFLLSKVPLALLRKVAVGLWALTRQAFDSPLLPMMPCFVGLIVPAKRSCFKLASSMRQK